MPKNAKAVCDQLKYSGWTKDAGGKPPLPKTNVAERFKVWKVSSKLDFGNKETKVEVY